MGMRVNAAQAQRWVLDSDFLPFNVRFGVMKRRGRRFLRHVGFMGILDVLRAILGPGWFDLQPVFT